MKRDSGVANTTKADIDELRLGAWLGENIDGFGHLEMVEKFPGGQSNPTYRLSDGRNFYVMRRNPFGKILPSAHAVGRKYRILKALQRTEVPVAAPYALREDFAAIGSPFYFEEMVQGRIFQDGNASNTQAESMGSMSYPLPSGFGNLL